MEFVKSIEKASEYRDKFFIDDSQTYRIHEK
jgi:hypothetical protein